MRVSIFAVAVLSSMAFAGGKAPAKAADKPAAAPADKAAAAPAKPAEAAPSDAARQLTTEEQVSMCAANLAKELECKDDFCDSMATLRVETDARFKGADAKKLAELKSTCLKEIAVDGAGDEKARAAKCTGWMKERGEMVVTKKDSDEMAACWTKTACKDRITCWRPHFAAMMEASAKKAGAPGTK